MAKKKTSNLKRAQEEAAAVEAAPKKKKAKRNKVAMELSTLRGASLQCIVAAVDGIQILQNELGGVFRGTGMSVPRF